MVLPSFNVSAIFGDRSCSGPSRATAGPGKPLSRGPITTPFRAPRSTSVREETRGGVSRPSPSNWSLEERRKLPQRGPGQCRKWILCICEVRKKPSGSPFAVFLSDGGTPKRHRARENFPPFLPLSTGLLLLMASLALN